jgi:hypothetical protein
MLDLAIDRFVSVNSLLMRYIFVILILLFVVSCTPVAPVSESLETLSPGTYHLSDLGWESAQNGLGPFEKDSSNGGQDGGDGLILTINAVSYGKGLGLRAPAEMVYDLGGNCTIFSARVGMDDLLNTTGGSVIFQVFADATKIWDSELMTDQNPAKATGQLSLVGAQKLRLVVLSGGSNAANNYADWVNPRITCDPSPPALRADAHLKGVYGPLEPWPTVAVHAALLPTAEIISFFTNDETGLTKDDNYNDQSLHNFTLVDIWNITTNQHSRADNTSTDLFCVGQTLTSDGMVFTAGGHLGTLDGVFYPGSAHTNIFNPTTNTWTQGPTMAEGRWYPTTITLPNKEILIVGGSSNSTTIHNYIPEIYNPTTNTLRQLSNASTQTLNFAHLYPWLHAAPNGKAFMSGPGNHIMYLNTNGQGSWEPHLNRDSQWRSYGSSVMYQPGKLLIMGGGGNNPTAVTINLSGGGAQVAATGSMNFGRTNSNATVLPNGEVFVNGGNTSGLNFDDTTSVLTSEMWNPITGTWRTLADAAKPRNYHSVALLLPDGRVWTAGGGGCGTCTKNQQSAQIFYPPYLFKKDGSGLLATRPRITSAPSTVLYNTSYTLTIPSASTIRKVSLIPLGSVTHAFNMNQRYIPLAISAQSPNDVTVMSPLNSRVAPPGYYLLFVVNSSGVPSVGRIIKVG